ncbi:hypothetical protein [Corallococcus llansteffanensis]|uniref:Uncharacterized protein n=1 Tax=Corallococcus llansteffanensis TaxID=2316731 RepID=A0A3A8QPG0_9BACT|nr:hypothetical protein [Corallococcus llansteffanensis]RKH68770.1 hypothetical protein D7V93_00845 [Corallococcus llansteffanensis]
MTSIGGTKRLNQKLQTVMKDGRVTNGEAKALVKTARKEGVTADERNLLKRKLTHQNDLFEPAAQKTLSKVAHFKPRNTESNSPAQVRAEVHRARFDGKVTLAEAERLTGRVQKNGTTEAERQMLQRQLGRYESAFTKSAKEHVSLLLRDKEPLAPNQTFQSGGMEVRANGVRQSAINEASRVTRELTAARPDIADRLRAAGHVVVIIPQGTKLTDLPEFQSLRGQTTFDGRPWDDVRGASGVSLPDGRLATAIPEENLSELSSDLYPGNHSVGIHELAHAIHSQGVTDAERQAIREAFDAQVARGGAFTDTYARSNDHEYFAQLSAAYFGRNKGQGANGAQWVQANDPQAYALLQQIYGPPRQL